MTLEKKIKNIMSSAGWVLTTEEWEVVDQNEHLDTFVNIGNPECMIPKSLAINIWKAAQKDFVELLNHNKTKLIKGEKRTPNEIWLDLDFLRSLVK